MATLEPQTPDPISAHGPTVAVVIPCYGYAHLLPEAVSSVAAQTWPHIDCVIVACSQDPTDSTASDSYPGASVESLITAASIAGHVRFLSDDLLEGRGVATRGDELARRYIATQFESFGLQPAGPDDSWEQPVPMMGLTAEVTKPLTVRAGSESIESGHLSYH